jgi:hypothetical protein
MDPSTSGQVSEAPGPAHLPGNPADPPSGEASAGPSKERGVTGFRLGENPGPRDVPDPANQNRDPPRGPAALESPSRAASGQRQGIFSHREQNEVNESRTGSSGWTFVLLMTCALTTPWN